MSEFCENRAERGFGISAIAVLFTWLAVTLGTGAVMGQTTQPKPSVTFGASVISLDEARAYVKESGKEISIKGGGAYVLSTIPGSPAESSGFKSGDILRKVNGITIGDDQDLLKAIEVQEPNKKFRVEFCRKKNVYATQVSWDYLTASAFVSVRKSKSGPISVPEYDVANLKWGMSKKEVAKHFSGKTVNLSTGDLGFTGVVIGDLECAVVCTFAEDELIKVFYSFESKHTSASSYIDDFRAISRSLTDKYGENEGITKSAKKSSYDPSDSEAGSLAACRVTFGEEWNEFSRTQIVHFLTNDESKGYSHCIRYTCRAAKSTLDKSSKGRANEKL